METITSPVNPSIETQIAEPSVRNRRSATRRTPVMTAAVLSAPEHIRIERVPIPEPRETEVRIRLEGCGVCGSNLPPWEGRPWFSYPFEPGAPGHEGWGRVDAIGPAVKSVKVGDRVASLCCRAFAQYDVAPETSVVRLPQELDDEPFPGEALGCAMNVFRRSDIQCGQSVAIIGIGFLGAVLTGLCSSAGANVIAISRRQFSLDISSRMGAVETIALDENDRVVEQIKGLTAGKGCPRVIEAVGLQKSLDLAGNITAERGRLIIAGYHQDGPRQVDMQRWNWRGLDVINAHERDPEIYVQGIRAAAAAVAGGTLDPSPLYTHCFSLDHLANALNAMKQRPPNFLKALVMT